ncbi:MAG: hypothetical protein ABEI74_01615 [Candidatus Pacearchaeota archaeon]
MNRKRLIMVFALVFASILIVQEASALGITPGRKTLDYSAGETKELEFEVINSENEDSTIFLKTSGALNESIQLNKKRVEFSKGERSKTVSYTLNMPQNLESPGTHKSQIVAVGVPSDLEGGQVVGSNVAISTQIHVEVPYPDKYLEAGEIKVQADNQSATFFTPIINKGTKAIEEAKAEISIEDPSGNEVTTIESGRKSLKSGKRSELIARWNTPKSSGNYKANIKITYDGQKITKEKAFGLSGNPVEIINVKVDDFKLGEVAQFKSMVKSNYNRGIENAFIEMSILDDNEKIGDIKSRTYKIPAKGKKRMVAYWDTEGVNKGSYNGKIVLNMGSVGRFSEEAIFEVRSDDIIVQGVGGEVIAEQTEDGNLTTIILIGLGILAALNIIWFAIVRKILQKKNKSVKSIFGG